jgi:O-antigen ligase
MRHFWFGQDGDQVKASMVQLTQGEHIVDFVNTYLTFFLNSGLLGLAAFSIPLALIFLKLWRRYDLRRTDAAARGMEPIVGALTAVCTTLIFTSFYERNPLWLIVALVGVKVLTRSIPSRNQDAAATVRPGTIGDGEIVMRLHQPETV